MSCRLKNVAIIRENKIRVIPSIIRTSRSLLSFITAETLGCFAVTLFVYMLLFM
jgi:hypothetical protein